MAYVHRSALFILSLFMLGICSKEIEGKCARFDFPTLSDDKTVTILNGSGHFDLQFRVKNTCNVSTVSFTHILVAHKANGSIKFPCLFVHDSGRCSSEVPRCRCPQSGSDVYVLELSRQSRDQGVWTWSSKPSVVEEHSLVVSVLNSDETSGAATTEGEQSKKTVTSVPSSHLTSPNWLPLASSISPATVANNNGDEQNFFLTQPGLIILTFNVVIVVAVVSLIIVVIVIRKGRRGNSSLPQDIVLQQLLPQQHLASLPHQQNQRQLPEVPYENQPFPAAFSASADRMPLPCARAMKRYRSEESNLYEIIDDDSDDDDPRETKGASRVCVSAPDLTVTDLPADYLNPLPTQQEVTDFRAMNPLYQNYPYFKSYTDDSKPKK